MCDEDRAACVKWLGSWLGAGPTADENKVTVAVPRTVQMIASAGGCRVGGVARRFAGSAGDAGGPLAVVSAAAVRMGA